MTVSSATIPFHRPSIGEREKAAVMAVLDSGWLTTGERTIEFEAAISQRLAVRHAVAVNSATAALHLALEALGVGPGHEVIVPAYTFAASGETVRYLGARPRIADIDARTLNLSVETIAAQVRPASRAIQVVHMGGLVADMTAIMGFAREHGLAVVEDAAHALPASRDGRQAAAWGDVNALSFYATKTVTTGEGGMLTTDSDEIADRARVMRLHGISRDAWKRYSAGGNWFYEIEDVGFKYNMTDIAAALGLVQLDRAEEMRVARERVANRYDELFGQEGLADLLDLPAHAASGDVHAWHLYPLRLRTERLAVTRDAVIESLKADGIGTSVHFIPLHLHPYYRRTYGYVAGDFPVAEREYGREISLPIYPDLTDSEVERVVAGVAHALQRAG